MGFDIHQLDRMDEYDEEALEAYQDALSERFLGSPEGQSRLEVDPGAGFWVNRLIHFGRVYAGVTIPQMTRGHVEEIVTEIFPRKVSLIEPEDADDAIPELVAFWAYLKREYGLLEADKIVRFLQKVAPTFKDMMYDPAKFGMAKSFFMMGQAAGFDMTDEEGLQAFTSAYNASLLAEGPLGGTGSPPKKDDRKSARKKKRKAARAARRRNRRK
jgi:hypothetical protein